MNFRFFGFIIAPVLLMGLIGIVTMILTSSYMWLFLTFFFWILLSGLGIATGFHRIYSHRCYEPKPWLDTILLACGTLACQSSSITWTATHIGYHHPYSDTEKDPHTPIKKGIWNAFMGWIFHVTPTSINHKYAVRLLRKPQHVWVHKNYNKILWTFMIAFFLLAGWKAFLFGYAIAASISILQDNLVNVFGHMPSVGYRNFETNDRSSNFPPLGYFGWGQGWHNNHHMYPSRFNFGVKWWEWDPCSIFVPLLKLGSIKDK